MGLSEYIVTFYSIFVGFAASTYIVGWGNMIKDFQEHKPYWGQMVWSMAFFSLMLNDWWVQYNQIGNVGLHPINLMSMLFQPTMVYFIGILIFPDAHQVQQSSNLVHFEKHKRAILILTLLIIGKIYFSADTDLTVFNTTRRDTSIFFALVAIGLVIKRRWYAELIGSIAMAFWVWRFWVIG